MMPPPAPYPGMYYQPMNPEHYLTHRNVWAASAIGLFLMWLGFLVALTRSTDLNVIAFEGFLIITGGMMGAFVSTAAALGSRKTTDMQNQGLFIWAGFLLVASALLLLVARTLF